MRTVFLCLLALAMAGPTAASEPWPTLEFEVFEGYGPPQSPGGTFLARQAGFEHVDVPAPMATPLAPALKAEMQAYLSAVAKEYQRMGFPPPELEPIVTRADGKRAYRVYWYAFGDTEHMLLSSDKPAVMAYACRGEVNARRLHLNARVDGPFPLENRLAWSSGKVPGRLDRLSDKGYGDLAHELFHAVQRGTAFFKANCEPPSWVYEGTAEAIGHDMAWKLRGVLSPQPNEQINRWGLRSYQRTFAVEGEGSRKFGYGTSSFWRYLAELEHALQSRAAPPPRPDAGPLIRTDAFDYGYLARLFSDSSRVTGNRDTLDWLDTRLGNDPRLRLGFERAFPDFLTVFADYGRYRVMGRHSPEERLDRVQKLTLGGCIEYPLDVSAAHSPAPATLTMAANGAGCVRVMRTDKVTEPLLVDIRASVDKRAAVALHAGVAGETRASPATVAVQDDGSAVVSWALELAPGASHDLVLSNVHDTPSRSRAVRIDLAFAISGWQWTGPPPPRPAAQRRAARPASGRQESRPVQQGPGAARLVRETQDAPAGGCRWPYPDAALYCRPQMQVVLSRRPRWLAWQEDALGPDEDDLASEGALLAFTASRSADALAALDEMQVRIKMPQIDHGFSGTLDNVLVSVTGGDAEDWVSRGPGNAGRANNPYYAASGRVRIDRYDPLELRGRFEADLVEMPPPGVAGASSLAVVASVSGDFVVGRPWEGDDRYEGIAPEADDIMSGIVDMLPGSLRTDERFTTPPAGADPSSAGNPGSGAGVGVGSASGCDCSCQGKTELLEFLEERSDEESVSPSLVAKAMCMVQCQAAYSACPDE